jgi:hypothetical protein
MKFKLVLIFQISSLLLLSANVLAVTPADLYLGEVSVADQSALEQKRAMPSAMEQVLQKLTGLRHFEEYPELHDALSTARAKAITFYYHNRSLTQPDGSEVEDLRFIVHFSKPAMDQLMLDLQLPIWKPERRPLSVWLVVDDGLTRKVLPIEYEYVWDHVKDIAENRGMPILRPLPDELGVFPVDTQLLWGGYTEDLADYGYDNVLIIASRRDGPEWNLRMNLDYMDQLRSWRNRNTDIQLALNEGINQAIDEIAAQHSIAVSDQGQWNIDVTVSGVVTAADYARCLDYFERISLVENIAVRSVASGKVRFELGLNAVPTYFYEALQADGVLSPADEENQYDLLP